MAALPRLPAAVEHRFLKAACGMPPRLRRCVFGPPPHVDGQTLAGDVHALLRIAELARGERLSEGADVNETRAVRRHEAGIVGSSRCSSTTTGLAPSGSAVGCPCARGARGRT